MGSSRMLPDPIRVTVLVTRVLEKLGIRYLIGGSLASTIHGKVRMTQDADIVADMQLKHVQSFVTDLQAEFYMDEQMIGKAIQQNTSFNIIHRQTMFKVDVFVPSLSPFTQVQLDRAQKQVVNLKPEVSAFFASPEDTILAKHVWFRSRGDISERQWLDVIGVLKVSRGMLDVDYLRNWAKELNVLGLFEKASLEAS